MTTAWWRLVMSSTAAGRCTRDRRQQSMTALGQVSQQSYGSTHNTTIAKAMSYSILLLLLPTTYCYYPDKVADHFKAWATKRCCPRCRFPFSVLRDAVVVLSATIALTLRRTTIILQLSLYLLLVGACARLRGESRSPAFPCRSCGMLLLSFQRLLL